MLGKIQTNFKFLPSPAGKGHKCYQHVHSPANETTNLYKVEVKDYKKLLQDSITTEYQKTSKDKARKINMEAKHLAEQLKLDDKIEQTAKQKAFITFKDHKPNFPSNTKCRIINPANSNVGRLSEKILQKINKKIRQFTVLHRW